MNKIKITLLLIGMLFCIPISIQANDNISENNNDVSIYPVSGIFTAKNIKNQRFENLLRTNKKDFINAFIDKFRSNFSNSSDELSERTKYKTFAAYVHIPRVSENEFKKSSSVIDIYLPMTASINFVNMATSETLYSYPYTYYSKYETTPSILQSQNGDKNIKKLYIDTYNKLLDEIINKSAQEFKPFNIETQITDKYKTLYILNKGLTDGIAKGDLLSDKENNQISVVYSSLDYAVAQSIIGKPSKEHVYTKFSNSSIMQLKKPKILFVNDFNNEKMYNIFSTAIGQSADFSLITVDKTFYDMQEALVSLNMGFKTATIQNREIPDYFLKLYFSKPLYTKYPSTRSFASLDRYSIIAGGIIFDKSGRIVFAKCVDDEIKDEVVSDIKFTDEARFEVLMKNVLNKLAASFVSEIKFKNVQMEVKKIKGNNILVEDKNGILKIGNTVTVFKKVNTDEGKTVLVPTWMYKIIDYDGSIHELAPMYPLVEGLSYPNKKDLVIMDTIVRNTNAKTTIYNYLPDKTTLKDNEVELKSFKDIAFNALSASMKSPISINKDDFKNQLDELNSGYGFKRKLEMPENKDTLTIKSVYGIKLLKEEKKKTLLKRTYNITIGIVAKNNGETIKTDGLQQEVTIVIPPENNEDIIEYELLKYIYPLIEQLAVKF